MTDTGMKDHQGLPVARTHRGLDNMYQWAEARTIYLKQIHFDVTLTKYRKDNLGFYIESVAEPNGPSGGNINEYNFIGQDEAWHRVASNPGWPESDYKN